MCGIKLVVIGNSHIFAIESACNQYSNGFGFSFINLSQPGFEPNFSNSVGQGKFFSESTHHLVDRVKPDVIISCIGGNAHNIFGLLEHPVKFDFVLPESPHLPLDKSREIIPYGVMRRLFEKRMSNILISFTALQDNISGPVIHLESPPPIPSVQHIRKYPGIFKEKIDETGITPAIIRYKLWRLHSSIVRHECEEHDIVFLSSPPECRDENGMLAQQAWNPDPTHGNEWYGGMVINQLVKLVPNIV